MSDPKDNETPADAPPSGSALSDRLRLLSRLAAKDGLEIDRFAIPPLGRGKREFPLSFAQERLWFLSKIDPANPAYHIVYALPLETELNLEALERALFRLVERHEGFRTRFTDREGEPIQVIGDALPVPVPTSDLRELSEEERSSVAKEKLDKISREPFDLEKGASLRVHALRMTDDAWFLLLATHHIVTDGWSSGILLRDLLNFYAAEDSGEDVEMPPVPVQSADFAVWQRERLGTGGMKDDLDYWKKHLQGISPLGLPLDHPRPPTPTSAGAASGCVLEAPVTESLVELGRNSGTTLFRTVLAAFYVFLSRLTGQTDIAVGTPVSSNRERPELSQVVGCFLNMLVLRAETGGGRSFREFLGEVDEVVTEGFSRQHIPFEAVVRELQPKREVTWNPLFNVTFTLERPHPTTEGWLEGKTLGQVVGVDTQTVRFDLEVMAVHAEDQLVIGFTYATDLFEQATVDRWVEEFRQLLSDLARDPDQAVGPTSGTPETLLSTQEFLTTLRLAGVRLTVDGENLRINAPSGALSPTLKEELGRRKGEILEALGSGGSTGKAGPIEARDRTEEFFASFAQQRLWFLDRFAPGTPAYNIPSAIKTSRLDEKALGQAVDALIERHEILRTSFVPADDAPRLRFHPPTTGNLEVVDLQDLPPEEREATANSIVEDRARRGFDLGEAPLIRVTLVQLGPQESLLVWCVHHIAADGWSLEVMGRDLAALYAGFQTGQQTPLPDLPVQFADFAHWQRKQIESERVKTQLSYWTQQLGGRLPVTELPADRPRPPIQTLAGARKKMLVAPELAEALHDLSRTEGVTLFMTLLSAFKVFLYRFTGETDIVVGTPTAGRDRPELENLVGFFVNNLVLRTDLSDRPTFRELLQITRRTVLKAHSNQDVPFDQLVEVLRPERSVSHPPLFQVMFNSPMAPQDAQAPAAATTEVEFQVGTARFDLTVEVYEEVSGPKGNTTSRGLKVYFEYNTDLFDESTIVRFQEAYHEILRAALSNPDFSVDELTVVPAGERELVTQEWNRTSRTYPADMCVHELIMEQAERCPDEVAVVGGGEHLLYRDLIDRSTDLARRLRSSGAGPGTLVGICVDRSVDMPVAVLGVLMSGAAYVPLDPIYPRERIRFMLEDSGASVLITQSHLEGSVPDGTAELLFMDRPWNRDDSGSEGGGLASQEGASGAAPTDLAYVIYTSGSTGKPKGVQIQHRALVNFLFSMAREPGMSPPDRLLAVTTLSFDISGLELLLPLLVGSRVIIATRSEAVDPIALADLIEESEATVMQATPATWRLLLKSGWRGQPDLRMLCGGEALDRDLAEQLIPCGKVLWNMYGPTEATIWSSTQRVDADTQWPVSIGRPIANTRMYVLDSNLNPAPIGVAGELFIGGDGLAAGYLNRPELTAERFIDDPLSSEAGAKLYRTGDGARFRKDGTIEFLGRLDSQVKVRGFRIELGEIESVLMEHPSVAQAAVSVREDVPGDQRLIAYVVSEDGLPEAPDVLQGHLKQSLPDYMVPSLFLEIPELPLTPNGKLDRKALPPPEGMGTQARGAYEAPETEIEKTIAAAWEQVLHVDQIGLGDNFFDLGGHSLLAVRVHSVLSEELLPPPTLIDLFQFPTVSSLAKHLASEDDGSELLQRAKDRATRQKDGGA